MKKLVNRYMAGLKKYMDKKDFRFAQQQSELGYKNGHFLLAKMYETGNAAVQQDRVNAYVLYYLAASKGLKEAEQRRAALEPQLLTEEWQEAQAVLRKINDKQRVKK